MGGLSRHRVHNLEGCFRESYRIQLVTGVRYASCTAAKKNVRTRTF
jgi:hypothetical protein